MTRTKRTGSTVKNQSAFLGTGRGGELRAAGDKPRRSARSARKAARRAGAAETGGRRRMRTMPRFR